MTRVRLVSSAGLALGLGMTVWAVSAEEQAVPVGLTFLGAPVTAEQVAQGQKVYAEYCASCHGANLEGQPNWRRRLENGRMPAPPHDESGHTWHHSDQDLFAITKLGVEGVVKGYESDMPAFGDILSDGQIAAVLAFIKSSWPERQRVMQARISARDESGS